jgi:membrane protein implicated in regulation of membrane protease activity
VKVIGGILLLLDIVFTIYWHFMVLAIDGYARGISFYQFKLAYVFSLIIAVLAIVLIVKTKQANKKRPAEEMMKEFMENPPPNINNINHF